MVEIRTKKGRNGRTYRYPIKNSGSSGFIQKSIKHPGRVKETIKKWYGKDGFDSKGRIKPEYLIKAKQKAKEEHNRSLEDAIDLAIRLKKMDKTKPYGIARQLAYTDVENLRKRGERARLIETNRKNKLYAPYISDLKPANTVSKVENTQRKKLPKATGLGAPVAVHLEAAGEPRKGKVYIAKITGSDPKFGLKREFLPVHTEYIGKNEVEKTFDGNLPAGTIIETGDGGSNQYTMRHYGIVQPNGKIHYMYWSSKNEGKARENKKFIENLVKRREKYLKGE